MMARISNLVRKELLHLGRDWMLTLFIITLPVLQLVLLAGSTSSSIQNLKVCVVDRDRSAASRELIEALAIREELDIHLSAVTAAEAECLLDAGDALLAVVIPAGFSKALRSAGAAPSIQIIADGSNDLVAGIGLRAAREAITAFARDELAVTGRPPLSIIDLRTSVRFNPDLDVKVFTVPAQVGFIVYQVTLVVASVALARERELGTLEQLVVMPLSRFELIVGKAIPALIVGMLNFAFLLVATVWGFGVPMRGSFWLLVAFTLLFVAAEVGCGILISGVAHTQQQAILIVFVLAMMDMAFSGYLVPVKRLPAGLRLVARVVPLRHYLSVIRSVMLRGARIGALWPHGAAMLGVATVVTGIAARNVSRRLD